MQIELDVAQLWILETAMRAASQDADRRAVSMDADPRHDSTAAREMSRRYAGLHQLMIDKYRDALNGAVAEAQAATLEAPEGVSAAMANVAEVDAALAEPQLAGVAALAEIDRLKKEARQLLHDFKVAVRRTQDLDTRGSLYELTPEDDARRTVWHSRFQVAQHKLGQLLDEGVAATAERDAS